MQQHVVIEHVGVAGEGGGSAAARKLQVVLQERIPHLAADVRVVALPDECAEGKARLETGVGGAGRTGGGQGGEKSAPAVPPNSRLLAETGTSQNQNG